MAGVPGRRHVIVFRHAPVGLPFLWESAGQPPGRWHGVEEGPAQYFASSPDAAWAEFVRHEEITDPADLVDVRRAFWAVSLPDEMRSLPRPDIDGRVLRGGRGS